MCVFHTAVTAAVSHFSRVRLCATPYTGSPPGSLVPGIFQARILEWVAIAFSSVFHTALFKSLSQFLGASTLNSVLLLLTASTCNTLRRSALGLLEPLHPRPGN